MRRIAAVHSFTCHGRFFIDENTVASLLLLFSLPGRLLGSSSICGRRRYFGHSNHRQLHSKLWSSMWKIMRLNNKWPLNRGTCDNVKTNSRFNSKVTSLLIPDEELFHREWCCCLSKNHIKRLFNRIQNLQGVCKRYGCGRWMRRAILGHYSSPSLLCLTHLYRNLYIQSNEHFFN